MSRDSSEERSRVPKCSFEVHRSEGDSLLSKKKYKQAIVCYNQALTKKNNDVHCLLRRSSCYMYLGDSHRALEDIDCALKMNPNNYKGILQKAEALYFNGDFENSLVFFHRGYKKRPERQEFRIGIQKCEEAINNALQDKNAIQMQNVCNIHSEHENGEINRKRVQQKSEEPCDSHRQSDDFPMHILPKERSRNSFGFLHDDHEFLSRFMENEVKQKWHTKSSDELSRVAREGLLYLDVRSQFWHEEKPLYSRKRRAGDETVKQSRIDKQRSLAICRVLEKLHQIDQYQHRNEHAVALKLAEGLLHEVAQWKSARFPERMEILANVQSMVGLSQLELGLYDSALESQTKALSLGEKCSLPEIVSHAIDNIGRIHAKRGDYEAAIDVWNKKIDDCSDKYELIWLRYEIGRCHLELQDVEQALQQGEKALVLAEELSDLSWQLNLNVLIGQANLQLHRRSQAMTAFGKALDLTMELKAKDAEKAIRSVIDDFQSTECELDSVTMSFSEMKSEVTPSKRVTLRFPRNARTVDTNS